MIRGLLLCGGKSSRFGSDKLLARHSREGGNPVPIAVHSARNLLQGVGNVLAVVPANSSRLREVLAAEGCEILASPHTERGLGASLAAGIAASAGDRGWIVALGDMPYIDPASIALVKQRLGDGALIVAPVLRGSGQRGHPVGFSRALREELLAIDGDEGARAVIAAHLAELVAIEVDDPGIVKDIDRPADLTQS